MGFEKLGKAAGSVHRVGHSVLGPGWPVATVLEPPGRRLCAACCQSLSESLLPASAASTMTQLGRGRGSESGRAREGDSAGA